MNELGHFGSDLIIIFPSEQIYTDDDVICDDLQSAIESGLPILLVNDVEDLNKGISYFKDKYVKSFNTFVINSHGAPGLFNIGSEEVTNASIDDTAPILNQLFNGKDVFISACKTGLEVDEKKGIPISDAIGFTKNAAKAWNCNLYTAMHKVPSGYKYNGTKNLNSKDWNEKEKDRDKTPDCFRVSYKGSCATIVRNLTINPFTGISHD